MISFILGFICGFASFFLGLHYSHIKIERNRDYRNYFKLILLLRYLSILFFVVGLGFIIINSFI